MAEPISRTPTDARYDPAKVAGASFDIVRRGFDEAQVRSFLGDLASAFRAAHAVEDQLRKEISRLEGRVDQAETIDDSVLVDRLGEEAARVLNAAREGAEERSRRADEDAKRVTERARTAAADTRARADRVLEEKLAEAEVAAAAVLAETEGLIEAARAEAEAVVEEARSQGRQMIDETIQHRERMLQSMERRRHRAKIQVERLKAGRDRLLSSYEVIQRTLDEAQAELRVSLPEAKREADRAARRIADEDPRTAIELEAELATARLAGLTDATPELQGEAGYEPAFEPEPEPEPVADEPEPEPVAEEPEPESEPVAEEPEPEEPEPEPDPEPVGTRGKVDDLFARLRDERADAVADASAVLAPSTVDHVEVAAAETSALLARRDEALAPIAKTLSRRVKRAMTSHQNDLLDLLRRGELDKLDDGAEAMVAAIDDPLSDAWTAGAGFYGPPVDADRADLAEVRASFVDRLVGPLRRELAGSLTADPEESAEAVRAVYRAHRGDPLAHLVGDLVAAAFARGIYDAIPKRRPLLWVPDETAGPCPDVAGNVAAGPTRRGEHFPSGSPCPPSHPGCRCLLKPLDQ